MCSYIAGDLLPTIHFTTVIIAVIRKAPPAPPPAPAPALAPPERYFCLF